MQWSYMYPPGSAESEACTRTQSQYFWKKRSENLEATQDSVYRGVGHTALYWAKLWLWKWVKPFLHLGVTKYGAKINEQENHTHLYLNNTLVFFSPYQVYNDLSSTDM